MSAVDANRVELADVVPEGGAVVLSLHWLDTWRTDPPLTDRPEPMPRRPGRTSSGSNCRGPSVGSSSRMVMFGIGPWVDPTGGRGLDHHPPEISFRERFG